MTDLPSVETAPETPASAACPPAASMAARREESGR